MKILFFIESLHSGGKERRLVELIKGLQKYPEIECELVLIKKKIHYKDIFDTGIKIHYIVRKYIKKDPRLFFQFYKIAKKFKPDIIHVWGNMVAIYSIPTKLLLNIPMIDNQITDAPNNIKVSLLSHRIVFPFAELIISNSKAGLKAYNAPKSKSKVIYNGFNFDRIKYLEEPDIVKKKFSIKTKFIICMVATFSSKKDYATYINAANIILENNKDVTFLCIGLGNDIYYRKLVNLEFKENIKFLGWQEKVESIINICDIGVLMSNPATHGEGISNAIMEYMSLGKPVIASESGGNQEIVKNKKTGFIIKSKSTSELIAHIEYILNNCNLAQKMGIEGKRRIQDYFSFFKMINSFIFLYNQLIKKK